MDNSELPQDACPLPDKETIKKLEEQIAAQFQKTVKIGDMLFGEGEHPPYAPMREQLKDKPSITHKIMPKVVSLEQAQAMLPFKYSLPSWIPDGFTLSGDVRVMTPEAAIVEVSNDFQLPIPKFNMHSVHFSWSHPDDKYFALDIKQPPTGIVVMGPIPVEPEGVMEVKVNGQPAALITRRKGFRPDTGETLILDTYELMWKVNGLKYELRAKKGALSVEELVHIAESVQ